MLKQISNERQLKLNEFGLNTNFESNFFDELVKNHNGINFPEECFPLVYYFKKGKFNEDALFIRDEIKLNPFWEKNGRHPNEPFSLNKCRMTKKQYNKYNSNKSFRDAISNIIQNELEKQTNGTYISNCSKCGDTIKKKSLCEKDEKFIHIDHFGEKQFLCIKNEFLKLNYLTDEDILPNSLVNNWIEHHNKFAKLRILCNICNCKQHNDL